MGELRPREIKCVVHNYEASFTVREQRIETSLLPPNPVYFPLKHTAI